MSALRKYLKMRDMECPELDYTESAAESPITDGDEAPGATKAEDDDPIRGMRGPKKRMAGQ